VALGAAAAAIGCAAPVAPRDTRQWLLMPLPLLVVAPYALHPKIKRSTAAALDATAAASSGAAPVAQR
jgi:hypothetical protein